MKKKKYRSKSFFDVTLICTKHSNLKIQYVMYKKKKFECPAGSAARRPVGYTAQYNVAEYGHMVARVAGDDSRGGWTRPGPTPSDLSSRSLLQWRREREREREREPGICIFFFALYTSTRAAKRQSFRGRCDFLSFHICTYCICNQHEYTALFMSVESRPGRERGAGRVGTQKFLENLDHVTLLGQQ